MVYHALVVDDNSVSAMVLSGMLKKYGIVTETEESAVTALKREDITSFQFIFADYLMPEMNGLEMLQEIKEKTKKYKKDVIMFLCTGSEEEVRKTQKEAAFPILQKPVKKKILEAALKRYISLENTDIEQSNDTEKNLLISGLDTAYALQCWGDIRIYKEILKEYYRTIDGKSREIRRYAQEYDLKSFKIEVHGLKSTSGLIGALEFAQLCGELEKECINYSKEKLVEKAEKLICRYETYRELLKPYADVKTNESRQEATAEQITQWLTELKAALEDFDYDQSVAIVSTMQRYRLPDTYEDMAEKLQEKIDNIDYDGGISIIDGFL